VRNATSAATISASGVLCDTHDCRLEIPHNGIDVFGPVTQRNTPDVLRAVLSHPAKSASAKQCREMSAAWSPTHPTNRLPYEL
jgi:hypothetical protein